MFVDRVRPAVPPAADLLTRAEALVARLLRPVVPASPLAARFQASLTLVSLLGVVIALVQGTIIFAVEARPETRLLRLVMHLFLALVLAYAAVGPLRAGHITRAASVWAFGTLAYVAVIAVALGLRRQPQIVALAMLPAMVLSVLASWRRFVAWWLAMVVVVGIGIANPRQDAGVVHPWTQFTSIVLVLFMAGVVLHRHRWHVLADIAESAERSRALVEANALLRDANAALEAVMAERDQLAREREAAHRLEATGRMAGAVAHDVNNILAVLRGHVDLLDDTVPAPADLAEMRRTITRGAGLTAQLLAFARRQPSRPEPLDLRALVHAMAPMLGHLAGAPVRLVLEGEDVAGVQADRTQFEQVLLNLVVNARDALPGGGTIVIRTGTDTCPEGTPLAVLEVEDDGVGMDAATQAHIFEPFFTTRGEQGGTGLGLSTVYGIVQRHGGRIEVRSAPGAGTRIRIRLPRAVDLPAAAAAPAAVPEPSTGERVALLVEDEAGVRQVLERMLQRAGCTVIVVPDGTQALLELERRPVRFDLVVSDVRMPGASGADVAAAYLAARPDGKVVLISGDLDPALVDGLRGAGDVTFLAKPFGRDALLAAIAPAGVASAIADA